MTISEILKQGIKFLNKNNIENPMLKARMILAFCINQNKEYLIANDEKEINKEDEETYLAYIQKIIDGEPIQHIIGKQEFMKLDFEVDKNVLIPRQDTEILVEEVITIAKKMEKPLVLDIGTGSGIIAISVVKYLKDATAIATDISKEAIKVAKLNAKNNGVDKQIKFIESNLFENIEQYKFDIIVSNPPYIKTEELTKLDREVQKEPILALDGGQDGLEIYKRIIRGSNEIFK